MQLFFSASHIFSSFLVFFIGLLISVKIAKSFNFGEKKSVIIYLWHTIFCITYAKFVIENSGDAINYYENSFLPNIGYDFGTGSVTLLTSLFSSGLGLSFLGVFLVFNIFGYIGLISFAASLQVATRDKSKYINRLATLIIFLPTVSFWSSAIGKDSISFMATGLSLWAVLNLRRRFWLMATAISVIFLVRPHIAGLMVIALAVSMGIQKKVSFMQRALIGGIALLLLILMIPFALTYSGLGTTFSTNDIAAYIEQRQGYNQDGGGGIDISAMSPPMQLFTYLFRPLPFEANSIFAFAASIDNMVLLFLFIWGSWVMIKRRKRYKQAFSENRMFLWIYSLSTWLILALTTANLGISVRQKWMFVPMLVFLFISVIGWPRKNTIVADSSLPLNGEKKS
jgi:hypothetical protein